MREIEENVTVCSHCGFSIDDEVPVNALKPKTALDNTYVVGKVLSIDGEGISYIGFDGSGMKAVLIREYMPADLAERDEQTVVAKKGYDAKYKALKSDFHELYLHLSDLKRLSEILTVYSVFEANNTVYAICEYDEDFIPLNKYMIEKTGELEWNEASVLFKPVLEALTVVHSNGVIHRGICPDNLVITPDGKLKLIGFSICSAKVTNSEIKHNISEGYAAPEQYTHMMPHGEWTDVYGLCAVLYKVLAGSMPPSAPTRTVNDNLIDLYALNDTVPKYVSRAIMAGLSYDYKERVQSVRQLIQLLYYNRALDDSADIIMSHSEGVIEEPDYYDDDKDDDEKGKFKMPVWLVVVLVCLPIVIAIVIVMYGMMIGFGGNDDDVTPNLSAILSDMSSSVSTDADTSGTDLDSSQAPTAKIAVNNFVGLYYDMLLKTPEYVSSFNIVPNYVYSDQYDKDYVIAQDIPEDTLVEQGETITVTVSKGPQYYQLPSFASMTAEEYKALLANAGIESVIYTEAATDVAEGEVIRIDPEVGSLIDYDNPDTVYIYKSVGE